MRIAFVTNFCSHYRVKTFEILASYYDVDYYFFSTGDEWYWQQQHRVRSGAFHYKYLWGVRLGRTRLVPELPIKLWRGNYDVYIKCINGRFALPITYLVARLRRKPFILWTGIWMRLQTPFHRLAFPLTRYVYRHANALVVYGEHVKSYLVTEGVSADRIFVAAHAVDNDFYKREVAEEEKVILRQQLGIEPQKKVVLYLGRLEKVKGLAYLLDGFASLQSDDAVLVLVGTGAERSHLERSIQEKGLADRVRFVGYISPEKTVPYYGIAWVCALPSITLPTGRETWGSVVNEAFNQGVPVIATQAVGAAAGGLVQNGVNGLVVPEQNGAALAQALRRILNERDIRDHMSQNARRCIVDWDNERMVLGFRHAVEEVVQKEKDSRRAIMVE